MYGNVVTRTEEEEEEENNEDEGVYSDLAAGTRIDSLLDGERDLEDEESSSTLLSLSGKPDRNMALLDDYEMEELDLENHDPSHRSGNFNLNFNF